jgi:hypothetical protein
MSIVRVDYRERQRLTAGDLTAEQDSRITAAGRHHLGPHDWGVVRGLHVTGTSLADMVVWSGVAIDGYGREIVVPTTHRLDAIDGDGCWMIALYYCDRPGQVPTGRECVEKPAPRTSQQYVLRVEADADAVERQPVSLEHARAAGSEQSWKPWRVVLARVGTKCAPGQGGFRVDYSATRYVRHRASALAAPTGRALVRLGLASNEDLYHVLISTRSNVLPALNPRVGIDRDGTLHVWRQLAISSDRLLVSAAVTSAMTLSATIPAPAGLGVVRDVALRVTPGATAAGSALGFAAEYLDSRPGTSPRLTSLALTASPGVGVSSPAVVLAGNGVLGALLGRRSSLSVLSATPQQKVFQAQVSPVPAKLSLEGPKLLAAVQESRRCGGPAREQSLAQEGGPWVHFKPASVASEELVSRDIGAVIVSAPTDLVQRSDLRFGGGLFDESDAGTRVSFGYDDGTDWWSAVELNGAGGIRLGGASLEVTSGGTIYLPAIGAGDPLLPELVALAFTVGLPKTTSTLALTPPAPVPATVKRGQLFDYKVKLTGTATVKRTFEVIVGQEQTDLAFRQIANPAAVDTDIKGACVRHRENKVDLIVLCLVDDSSKNRLGLAKAELIVTD